MTRKTKKPEPISTEKLYQTGYDRGKRDWEDGIHDDPFLDHPAYPAQEDRNLLSAGWGAGQDKHFRDAADAFDHLLRRHARH